METTNTPQSPETMLQRPAPGVIVSDSGTFSTGSQNRIVSSRSLRNRSTTAVPKKTGSENNHAPIRPSTEATTSATHVQEPYVKHVKAYGIMAYLTFIIFMTSVSSGLITTSIPTIARDLNIPAKIMYWPLSVYSLTTGACLILAGTIADIVGSKRVFLLGTALLCCFTLGCGLAQSDIQLTMFRAMQGIAVAMCLPTSVGIICQNIAPGRLRNLAFACTGVGQPLGFSAGLVFGGIFIRTVGWRPAWYFAAGAVTICCPVGFMLLPTDILTNAPSLKRLRTQVDWLGACIESAGFAMLANILVQISEDRSLIRTPTVIALLTLSLVLMPTFVWWMSYAENHRLPVLIPNRLWKDLTFTTVCIMIMMSYAVMQALELYATLFFQQVQELHPLQSSIRLLPSMIVGAALNLTVGLFIHRVSAMWLVFPTSLACSVAPLIMALIHPEWPYWQAAFPAQILHPLSADVLFCVGIIVISQVFPENTKSLAGAVFNTVAQFGTALGLALIGIIADTVTEASGEEDVESPAALLEGYKAAFWTAFALTVTITALSIVGLRGVGTANEVNDKSEYDLQPSATRQT